MNHTGNTSHDEVLRARVALLGSGTLPIRHQVAAYRTLVRVSPLAYLPLLTEALYEYSRIEFALQPETALALRAEGVAAARRMCGMETGWESLLLGALGRYREQLELMGRGEELAVVEAEMGAIARGGR
ncbi:hypothetical protein [Streptomyces sp. NPDC096339]|uniref:hypothetical protein n=1 Tax=Streptomyces sp. NPDC096339 TaxID=3366086 RepID=UPI00382AA9C9